MSEIEKRLWMMLCGLSMIGQGFVLFVSLGYLNLHLYVQIALFYSERELYLSKKRDD